MTGAWKRRERTAARALGSARTVRRIGESAPDMAPVELPNGVTLQGEVKHRARLPALIVGALGQAARYTPGAVPVAIVSERGGPQLAYLACLYLSDLARLLGLGAPPALPPPNAAQLGGRSPGRCDSSPSQGATRDPFGNGPSGARNGRAMNSYPCGCRPGRLCAEHVPFGGEQPNASVRRATVDLVLPADPDAPPAEGARFYAYHPSFLRAGDAVPNV